MCIRDSVWTGPKHCWLTMAAWLLELLNLNEMKWSRAQNDPQPWNDPQIDPEMIPTPKWSQPRNYPHFYSCRPRNDPQGIREWWLNMGLWIAFCSSLKSWNPVISFYSHEISNKRKVVVGSLFRYSLDLVSFQWTILVWCNVSNRLAFSSSSVLCF